MNRLRPLAFLLAALLVAGLDPAGAAVPGESRPGGPEAEGPPGLVLDGLIPDAARCGPGLYRVAKAPGLCTHGPDPRPDVATDAPAPAGSSAAALAAPAPVRCDGDGVSGHRVQLMYLRAADVPDRYSQFVAAFQQRAADVDGILAGNAARTGGSRHFRFVHDGSCLATVARIEVAPAGDDDYGATVAALRAGGHDRTDRSYLLFVDAGVYCGIANTSVDDQPGQSNRNNSGPSYARVDVPCWESSPAIVHELLHVLGAVQGTAPNGTRGFHCTDEFDILCYSDPPDFPPVEIVCPDESFDATHLDCNDDDYFHTDPPAGSYLDTHWNTADSRFLIIGAPTAVVPPSGARGSFLSASVGPNPIVTPGKFYRLMWADAASGITCDHPDARKLTGPVLPADDGSIAVTTGQVPRQAARGPASICFAKTSNPSADNSDPATFSVL